KKRFSIIGFYERRARRILPALVTVLIVTTPFAWWLMVPSQFEEFSESIAATAIFASNIYFWTKSGYFATAAELKPLLHTWSLAVEEQFYIVFPLLMACLWRLGRGAVWAALCLLFVASLITAEILSRSAPSANFFFLFSRGWELLAGAMAAFWLSNRTRPTNPILAMIGLAMVLGPMVVFDETTRMPGLPGLVPVVGTVLILVFSCGPAQRILSLGPVVGIGLISYSAYLWHNPMFSLARVALGDHPPALLMGALTLTTLALAWISWRYIERPFRRRGSAQAFGRRAIFLLSGASIVGLLAVASAGISTRGFETHYLTQRLSPADAKIYARIARSNDIFPSGALQDDGLLDNGACQFAAPALNEAFRDRFAACADLHGAGVLILGDSHARNFFNAAAWNDYAPFVVGLVQGGCRAHNRDKRGCQYDDLPDFVAQNAARIGVLFYQQSGSYFVQDREGRINRDDIYDGAATWSINMSNPAATLSFLDTLAQRVPVVWIGPRIEARRDLTDIQSLRDGLKMNPAAIEIYKTLDTALAPFVSQNAQGVTYQSSVDVLGSDPSFLHVEDCVTFADIDHYSQCGEALVGRMLHPVLAPHLP
ncbi:MAG: acyltransferase family protein, partial [Pseudomonadota bacterium]